MVEEKITNENEQAGKKGNERRNSWKSDLAVFNQFEVLVKQSIAVYAVADSYEAYLHGSK
jgi:hypothetical protein